jgi:hypothetical protein
MAENLSKIKRYASLFQFMEEKNKGEAVLLWYTVSQTKKEQLEAWCKEYGVPCEVMYKQDF